ncbi:invasion associated locus B family protein [Kiloniella litopenaei]|uniref:invasion associated locus B family protein n=1 Tax=Kiloniella litopenaei TaxID=1549748 RepID=UPI003BABDA59
MSKLLSMKSAIPMALMVSVSFGLSALTATTSSAQGIKAIGQHKDWTSYSYTENGHKVCFMNSVPKKAEGKYKKRGDIYLVVSHRAGEKRWDEISIQAGYSYRPDSQVTLSVGKSSYKFFTAGDSAWAYNQEDDQKVINAMIKGSKLIVRGVSGRGTKTKDTYSLSGFSAAYRAINQACGKK